MSLLDFIARGRPIKNPRPYQKSTVYDAVRRYKELGNTKDRTKSGHPRSCRTKSNIKAVRERVRKKLRAAVESFRGRLERVIAVERGHIEK